MRLHVCMDDDYCVNVCVSVHERECSMTVCERERREREEWARHASLDRKVNRSGVRLLLIEGKRTSIRSIYIIFNICIFIYTYIIHG